MNNRISTVVVLAALLTLGCPPDGVTVRLTSNQERLPHPTFHVSYESKELRGRVQAVIFSEVGPDKLTVRTVWHAVAKSETPPVVESFKYGVLPPGFRNHISWPMDVEEEGNRR